MIQGKNHPTFESLMMKRVRVRKGLYVVNGYIVVHRHFCPLVVSFWQVPPPPYFYDSRKCHTDECCCYCCYEDECVDMMNHSMIFEKLKGPVKYKKCVRLNML